MKQELVSGTALHPAALDIEGYVREALHQALSETFARFVARENVEMLIRQLLDARNTPPATPRREPAAPGALLTSREREILKRIAAGDSNKEIARTFGLSVHTVKRHVANILGKIGVSSRVQAAMWLAANH